MPLHRVNQLRGETAVVSAAAYYHDATPTAFTTQDAPPATRAVFLSTVDIGEQVLILTDTPDDHGNVVIWQERIPGNVRRVHQDCLSLLPMHTRVTEPAGAYLNREIAAHVLYVFKGTGYKAGSFVSAIIDALSKADHGNWQRLFLVFPGYAEAVRLAQQNHQGVDLLQAIMRDEQKKIELLWPGVYG